MYKFGELRSSNPEDYDARGSRDVAMTTTPNQQGTFLRYASVQKLIEISQAMILLQCVEIGEIRSSNSRVYDSVQQA